MKAEIRYLYNSGFTLKTDRHLFIFDYYLDSPKGCGLEKGVVDPEEIKDLDVVVFVSHSHPDHYNPKIFSWRKTVGKIRYVLSDDIKTSEDVIRAAPGREYDLGDLSVRTLDSTDIGVAFLIQADGLCIYHAGDLNDWYWNGEPDSDNREMTRRYREQIDTLKGEAIDIAFVPADPRLEEHALRGLDYFMRTVGAELAVPMHFSENTSVFEELKSDSRTESYRDRIAFFSQRGEMIPYPNADK
ncbi:MBL fold metallo-hydrolase [Caproiciproducens sp. R2]|uniref:MBL fold metallo-hydrolase n=1 Tax=Caproiciproducens sp. R2 TaxID=3435187 RepID=UPI0040348D17